jgi:glycosyltransferase involved in cell wall biosynthesis
MNISIVIPAKKEQYNLPKVLNGLLKLKLKFYEIIVVVDSSADRTGKIAYSYARKFKNVRVFHRESGIKGFGVAIKDGTQAARGKYVVWVMSDNSDDLSTIPRFIESLKEFDVVFGSRYIKGSSADLGAIKSLFSSGYSFVARILFNIKTRDITNAFRAFKKEVFNNLNLESKDFAICPEFAIKAHLKGYKLGEVPTTYKSRVSGQQKSSLLKMSIPYIKILMYRFKGLK